MEEFTCTYVSASLRSIRNFKDKSEDREPLLKVDEKKECVLFSDLSVYLIYTCTVYIFITIYKGWVYQNNSHANAPQSLSNDCFIWKSIGYKILNKYYSYYY